MISEFSKRMSDWKDVRWCGLDVGDFGSKLPQREAKERKPGFKSGDVVALKARRSGQPPKALKHYDVSTVFVVRSVSEGNGTLLLNVSPMVLDKTKDLIGNLPESLFEQI